jgi:hypothetical protein
MVRRRASADSNHEAWLAAFILRDARKSALLRMRVSGRKPTDIKETIRAD